MNDQPVIVYQFAPRNGVQPGPFCLKLVTWLRMAGIPFDTKMTSDTRAAPKGKIPFAKVDGKRIGDSALIIEYLRKTRGCDPDAGLSPRQIADAHTLTRTVEDHLYWILVYSRWVDPTGQAIMHENFFGNMRAPQKWFMPRMIFGYIKKQVVAQGMGRHSAAEIYAMGAADLEALSAVLGDNLFFLGNEPRSVDAAIYGQLSSLLSFPIEGPMQVAIKKHPNLIAYKDRMATKFGTA